MCTSLEDIKLSDSLEKIYGLTFNECTSLKKIEIPENVKVIEGGSFINCSNLQAVKISSNIKEIQKAAFIGFNDDEMFYAKNKEVEILLNDAGVISSRILTEDWNIDNECSIDDIKYRKNDDNTVSIIGYTPCLNNKVNLNSKINVNGNKYNVTAIDYNAFTKSNIESVVIPDSIITIGEWAFSECKNLEEIKIPNSVTSIGTGAFTLCESLNEIILPNNLKKICSFTFNECTSLKGIAMPEEIQTIEQFAFINCSSLKGIKIPSGIREIQPEAFINFDKQMIFLVEDKNVQELLINSGVDPKNIINIGITVIVTND